MPPRKKAAQTPAPALQADPADMEEILETLLMKCLEPSATSADVGRLYKMKDSLVSMNWQGSSNLDLKQKLVQCFESRVFYKSVQGQNFLALIFNLHPLMLPSITEVLRRVVMAFPPAMLDGCSAMLFKAWQSSTGGMRIVIEQSLMEWMRKALFASVAVAERVRRLLQTLHTTTRTTEIDEFLARYYGPILFRHTKVANWEVRFNAIAILCAAFPVIPPDRTNIEFEQKIMNQVLVLKEAMEDPNDHVRKCAVLGAGRILKSFWEVFTPAQSAILLDCVVEKAGKDKKSPRTRIAAIDAICLVLENPLTHGVMAEVLPYTNRLLDDESPQVRLAYVAQLLGKVVRFKTLPLLRVVEQGPLLARLATDHAISLHTGAVVHSQIASAVADLIAPSLFTGTDDYIDRCAAMAELLPQAFLAVVANCTLSQVDRVRYAAALYRKAVKLGDTGVARIVLRAATECLRLTKIGGIQDGESVFGKESEEFKLSEFLSKHVEERSLLKLVNAAGDVPTGEVLDWLAQLDSARLPSVVGVVEKIAGSGPSWVRLTTAWGLDRDGSLNDAWDVVAGALKGVGRSGSAATAEAVAAVRHAITASLVAGDSAALTRMKPEIVSFIHASSVALPNIAGLTETGAEIVELIELSLTALTRINLDLAEVSHAMSVGLISSLTAVPVQAGAPAGPAGKKARTAQPSLFALSGSDMTRLCSFYLRWLLVCAVTRGMPLRASKFTEIAQRVLFEWAGKSGAVEESTALFATLVEARQGAWTALPLLEGLLHDGSCGDDVYKIQKIVNGAMQEFGYSQELAALVTKLSIRRTPADLSALDMMRAACVANAGSVSDAVQKELAVS